MQVTESLCAEMMREFTIVISAKELEAELTDQLAKLAQQVTLPGFRPGKVPHVLLRQRYGEVLLDDIVKNSVIKSSQRTIEEHKLRLAHQPNIEIISYEKNSDLKYKLLVELMPQIKDIDFSEIEVERLIALPNDGEINDTINRMAESQRESVPIKKSRLSKLGDVIVIDFDGKINGESFEGCIGKDYYIKLGSNKFIPGFEEQLMNTRANESNKLITVCLPLDYPDSALAGKEARFNVTIKEIRELKPIEINNSFAQIFGMDSLNSLKKAIGEKIKSECLVATRNHLKFQLLDVLSKEISFIAPSQMVKKEYDKIVSQAFQYSSKKDGFLALPEEKKNKNHKYDHSAIKIVKNYRLSEQDEINYQSIAERRVRLGLLLSEIGRQNNIQVTDEEVSRSISEQASRFLSQDHVIFDSYRKNKAVIGQVRALLLEDKVIDFVMKSAKVKDNNVSVDELFCALDANKQGLKPMSKQEESQEK
ncbi:trigger factor [Candidatus Endolissoclinum faulkneri L2]|uniref:Trigger factor n=1 Tax=Candidatus Endolissoclinum faulkneri L2 TaxID=1193729 RepID=K7YGV5_9PROT|nr:trigger factor [Candidatus Endolissoclinum faulkneri]AFX98800.1 trigger factor [Candidatus Endolissoclinum faulkneri L2]